MPFSINILPFNIFSHNLNYFNFTFLTELLQYLIFSIFLFISTYYHVMLYHPYPFLLIRHYVYLFPIKKAIALLKYHSISHTIWLSILTIAFYFVSINIFISTFIASFYCMPLRIATPLAANTKVCSAS